MTKKGANVRYEECWRMEFRRAEIPVERITISTLSSEGNIKSAPRFKVGAPVVVTYYSFVTRATVCAYTISAPSSNLGVDAVISELESRYFGFSRWFPYTEFHSNNILHVPFSIYLFMSIYFSLVYFTSSSYYIRSGSNRPVYNYMCFKYCDRFSDEAKKCCAFFWNL